VSLPKTLRTRTVWHDDLFATSIAILFCYRQPTQTAEIVQQQLWLFAAIHAWVTVASVPLRQTIVEAQFIGILQLLAIDDEVIVSTLRAGFSPCLVCTSYWWILCRLGRSVRGARRRHFACNTPSKSSPSGCGPRLLQRTWALLDIDQSLERRKPRMVGHCLEPRRSETWHGLEHDKVLRFDRGRIFGEAQPAFFW
jgi:hypothetical protein